MPVQPERSVEQESIVPQFDTPRQTSERSSVSLPPSASPLGPVATSSDPRAGVLKQVEGLLADGLQGLYMSLPDARRAAFKQTGELVANKITDMIMYGKARAKEIWKLIGEWLRAVPGVNRYFLEQEIKIKTDRIMMFAESSAKA